jgi:hypothetical protein
MPVNIESQFVVSIVGDDIVCRRPDGLIEQVSLSDLNAVFVETNDSGPWGMDVWWILDGEASRCAFPLGATGENDVLARLKELSGFEVKGMNSVSNQRFLCWKKRTY